MHKGMKILGKVLSAAVLLLLFLPLLLSLLLDIPAVQNFVVQKAVTLVSEKLGTKVAIDRVDIGLFSRVRVKGFYVEDFQHDTLLYVGQAEAFVTGFGLFSDGIVLSRAELGGAKLCLHETPGGEMNIKQVVERLSNPDRKKKGEFKLTIHDATIDGMEFCLEKLEHRNPEYGIDFSHLHIYDLVSGVRDLTIDGSVIHTTFESLSATERSGFRLENLTGAFYLTNGCIGFEQATIRTPRSQLEIPSITLVGGSWNEYKDFIGEVQIDAEFRRSTLSSDDLAYFSPKLRSWHTLFSDVDLEASGTVDNFMTRIRSLDVDGTTLTGKATVTGLPDIASARFDVELPRLTTSARSIRTLAASVGRTKLPAQTVAVIGRAGRIDLAASFRGTLSLFDLKMRLRTPLGHISGKLATKPLRAGRRQVTGSVRVNSFRLGDLLGKPQLLGSTTLTARVDGAVGRGFADAEVRGNIAQLDFNGYAYRDVRLDGRLRNKEFDGRIFARDPNLDFDFLGLVDLNDEMPRYDFVMDLHHADLAALHLNRRDSISELSARVEARAGGHSLDDLNGRIRVLDATYRYNDKSLTAKDVSVTGENSEHSKFVELRSDFADATFRSKASYREVFAYLRESAAKYLPILHEEKLRGEETQRQIALPDDYSLLSVNIRNINPVMDAISEGLQVADGSKLQLLFNPAGNQLSFKASSEYIERKRMLATRLNVNASNRGDSLTLYASAEDLYLGMLHLPNLSVTGGARRGDVQLSTGFSDTTRRFSGQLSVRASIADEHGPSGRVVGLRILPSRIVRGDKMWRIMARNIQFDTTRVVIDRFYVRNDEQVLALNGIASRSRDDSLTLRLRNFDLAPLTQFADRMGYVVEGRTDGFAIMKSVLREGQFTADIMLDSLEVNDIPAPPMRLTSQWDFQRNRAGLTVANRIKGDTLVRGFYAPSQHRYYARMRIDSLDMGLLDPVLSGVVSRTRGLADMDLVLTGRGRDGELSGKIHATGLSTTVDFTQVTYTVPEVTLDVKNSLFSTKNAPVLDTEGNSGLLDFSLDLGHVTNIAYDLRVTPDRMLVLNTTSRDNDLFYGKVYASGLARIRGDKLGVNMDVTATTAGSSSFFMPLSGKSNISAANFVTFVQPAPSDSLSTVELKKLSFERKQRKKSAAPGQMNIALALDVRPNTEVELTVSGNAVRARGEGSLNLQINPRAGVFEMYGDYTIAEGSYQFSLENLINKKFVIENGSTIQWTGAPTDAMLDIDAVYKVKASLQPLLQGTADVSGDRSVPVECVIHLGERLTNPAIGFDVRVPGVDPEMQSIIANALSTPESVDMQFLYLLLFNSFMAENSAAGSNMGASVSAATGLEFLTNQLSNWLSADDYNLVIRYRPKSELTSDEVDFGLSKSLINNRLFVELEGNYIIDNKQAVNNDAMSNFMGEAYVTYLIDRSGALRLKLFTQTIDRFDENQGLQEYGLGIYFKEDFNNFRDFRQRLKERFTNRKRRARREERRAEKQRLREAARAGEGLSAADAEEATDAEAPDNTENSNNK